MTRKEIYQFIKKNPNFKEYLKDECKINYTTTQSNILEQFIKEYQNDGLHLGYEYSHCSLDKLVEVLEKKRILLKSEVDYIKA